MTRAFRPMKGEAIEEHHLDQFSYPLLVAGKMDGIRGAVLPEGVVSNRIKLLPSGAVQAMFGGGNFAGLDGEVIVGPVGAPDVFKRSTSFVMSRSKNYPEDGVHFYVFDDFTDPTLPYGSRYDNLRRRVKDLQDLGAENLHLVPQHIVHSKADVLRLEDMYLGQGLEGIMIRSLEAPYKFGRGTIKQQSLVKFKRFEDFEATVVGFEELYHNQNEATTDARGLTKRTSHAENQVAGDTLGAIVLKSELFPGETFKIGTGFTQADRDEIWRDREELMGATVTVSYQKVGVDVKPRFPKFKGFRKD